MIVTSVVIADDEPHLVHILAYNLKKVGITVHVAKNGQECFDLAVRVRPDLIISDFQMPLLDGLQACVLLKNDARTKNIPVLMLTARGHRLTAEELARTNIRGLLPKPFSARQLLASFAQLEAGPDKAAA